MTLIALTGGIASGKSTIAQRLQAHGAVVIDADQLAREVVEPGSKALAAIIDAFGKRVLLPDGTLDRSTLGAVIFGDAAQRSTLNGIVHPAVQQLAAERIVAAHRSDPSAIVVYEIPLLVETDAQSQWDLVVVADSPADLRTKRLIEIRGLDEGAAARRVASQASDDERRKVGDVCIDTSATLEHTHEQVDALWRSLQDRSAPKR